MHIRVKQRAAGALILIAIVVILIPIIFRKGNIGADEISMGPITPPAPASLTVGAAAAKQAQILAAKQKLLQEQAPPAAS